MRNKIERQLNLVREPHAPACGDCKSYKSGCSSLLAGASSSGLNWSTGSIFNGLHAQHRSLTEIKDFLSLEKKWILIPFNYISKLVTWKWKSPLKKMITETLQSLLKVLVFGWKSPLKKIDDRAVCSKIERQLDLVREPHAPECDEVKSHKRGLSSLLAGASSSGLNWSTGSFFYGLH